MRTPQTAPVQETDVLRQIAGCQPVAVIIPTRQREGHDVAIQNRDDPAQRAHPCEGAAIPQRMDFGQVKTQSTSGTISCRKEAALRSAISRFSTQKPFSSCRSDFFASCFRREAHQGLVRRGDARAAFRLR